MIQKFIIGMAALFTIMSVMGLIVASFAPAIQHGVTDVAVSGFVMFMLGAFGAVGSFLLLMLFE